MKVFKNKCSNCKKEFYCIREFRDNFTCLSSVPTNCYCLKCTKIWNMDSSHLNNQRVLRCKFNTKKEAILRCLIGDKFDKKT